MKHLVTALEFRGIGPEQGFTDLRGSRMGFALAAMQELMPDAMPAHRGTAPDAGRHARFEAFPAERGAAPRGLPVDALAIDITAVTP